MDEKISSNMENIGELTPTPHGDCLWKLPEDDDIDVSDVFDCPIIPGTSGVEC